MTLALPRNPMPLLGKELVELAARRRTYVVRAVYAVLLYGLFFLDGRHWLVAGGGPREMLGHGRALFGLLVTLQFLGILLFTPAMMAGVVAGERERRSLGLLFLTGLRPTSLLLEKYLSRVLAVAAFLLLSLPLLAVCYAYGGVTPDDLLSRAYVLLLVCLQTGALALACSCYCATGLGAVLLAYVVCIGFYVGWPMLVPALLGSSAASRRIADALLPLHHFSPGSGRAGTGMVVWSVLSLCVTLVSFLLARKFLVRQASVRRRRRIPQLFRRLDGFFERVNRLFGGYRLGGPDDSLPADNPVAWRETTRRSLGNGRYCLRLILAIEVPLVVLCTLSIIGWGYEGPMGFFNVLLTVLWAVAAVAVTAKSANAIQDERTRGSLDVLLTTPLAGRDIVRHKLKGVGRLNLVLLAPVASLVVIRFWWLTTPARFLMSDYLWSSAEERIWVESLALLAGYAVFQPLLMWLSVWMGLRCRTRGRAVNAALLLIVVWNLAALLFYFQIQRPGGRGAPLAFYLASPLTLLRLGSSGLRHHGIEHAIPVLLIGYVAYSVLLWFVRKHCLRHADRLLGRAQQGPAEGRTP